ncbi:uncharacterized protein DNG_07396 [Cephalotrichum gorgonifer]|uniref:Uncharacterized protein n=1 Tax=Cephalotrichum gorgonifer TaxID=2041049 RepID=A0AAE8SXD0_9PEZI|nr:uncharacterized protein DNG_07396 [Cephalotrichum gorgonifer]
MGGEKFSDTPKVPSNPLMMLSSLLVAALAAGAAAQVTLVPTTICHGPQCNPDGEPHDTCPEAITSTEFLTELSTVLSVSTTIITELQTITREVTSIKEVTATVTSTTERTLTQTQTTTEDGYGVLDVSAPSVHVARSGHEVLRVSERAADLDSEFRVRRPGGV